MKEKKTFAILKCQRHRPPRPHRPARRHPPAIITSKSAFYGVLPLLAWLPFSLHIESFPTHYLIMTSTTEEDVLKDLMARRWTRLGDEAPTKLLPASVVVAWDESKAIITGGFEHNKTHDSVSIYNKDTMVTETLPSMLQARSDHAAVIVGGNLLFVIGGDVPGGITLNSIEVLDLNDPGEWRLFPVKLGEARSGCC